MIVLSYGKHFSSDLSRFVTEKNHTTNGDLVLGHIYIHQIDRCCVAVKDSLILLKNKVYSFYYNSAYKDTYIHTHSIWRIDSQQCQWNEMNGQEYVNQVSFGKIRTFNKILLDRFSAAVAAASVACHHHHRLSYWPIMWSTWFESDWFGWTTQKKISSFTILFAANVISDE